MAVILFLVVTGIFLVPFCGAFFYFVLGIRSSIIGRRENNRAKLIGGYNSMAISFLAIIAVTFVWYLIVEDILGVSIW